MVVIKQLFCVLAFLCVFGAAKANAHDGCFSPIANFVNIEDRPQTFFRSDCEFDQLSFALYDRWGIMLVDYSPDANPSIANLNYKLYQFTKTVEPMADTYYYLIHYQTRQEKPATFSGILLIGYSCG